MHTFRHSALLPAAPASVRNALLDGPTMQRILGAPCVITSEPGTTFDLMDGLITGSNATVRDSEIVQSWRMGVVPWPQGVESRVTLRLLPEGDATRVALEQTWIPAGCLEAVREHWADHVFAGLRAELEPKTRLELRSRFRRLLNAI